MSIADGGTIAEFLASIGFKADENSLKSSLLKVAGFATAAKGLALGIFAGTVKIAQGYAALEQESQKLRTTGQNLEMLKYMAEQTGASTEALSSSLSGMISKNPRIKDSAQALSQVARRMKGMNEQQRRLYAQRMGIDPTLIPMLTQDVSALKNEFSQMYEVAGVDAKQAAQESKRFLAELGKLKAMALMLARAVGLAFIGRMRGDVERLRRSITENFDKIKKVLGAIIEVVLRISGVVSAFVRRGIKWIMQFVEWFDKLDDSQQNVIIALGALLVAWRLFNAGFLATPIGLIITALLALFFLVDDFLNFLEGNESKIDWSPWADDILDIVEALKPLGAILLAVGEALLKAVTPVLKGVLALLKGFIKHIGLCLSFWKALFGGDFEGAAEVGKKIIQNLVDTLKAVFSNLMDAIQAYWGTLWERVKEEFPDFAEKLQSILAAFNCIFNAIKVLANIAFNALKDKFFEIFNEIKAKVDFLLGLKDKLVNGAKGFVSGIAGMFGGADETVDKSGNMLRPTFNPAPTGPALTPGPAQAAALNNNQQNNLEINSQSTFNIDGSGDPKAVAQNVNGQQDKTNQNLVRYAQARTR